MNLKIFSSSLPFLAIFLLLGAPTAFACTDFANSSDCSGETVCQQTPGQSTGTCVAPNANNSDYVAPTPTGQTTPGSTLTPTGQTTPGSTLTPTGQTTPGSGLTNPLGFSDIPSFLTAVLGLVVQIGGIVVVLMLVYVGFLFVTAQGKEEKIREAREALLYTVIGALILLGAQAISSGIQATVSALGSGQTSTTQTTNPFTSTPPGL